MHRHLVTVEIRIERGTNKWMKLDGLTFDQNRFEGLDAESVQGWRTVQHDRVFANDFFENIPDFSAFALDHFLGSFDGCRHTTHLQFGEDKRLEQFERHLLRQTALMQSQCRTNHDDRTTRVINTLTEEVLTEAALLTLDHVSE